jgi:hypothetical protein
MLIVDEEMNALLKPENLFFAEEAIGCHSSQEISKLDETTLIHYIHLQEHFLCMAHVTSVAAISS